MQDFTEDSKYEGTDDLLLNNDNLKKKARYLKNGSDSSVDQCSRLDIKQTCHFDRLKPINCLNNKYLLQLDIVRKKIEY